MFANGTKGASSTLAAGHVTVSLGVGDRVDYSAGTGKGEELRGGVINPLTLKSDDEGTVVKCFDPVDATDCLQRALIGPSPVVTWSPGTLPVGWNVNCSSAKIGG